MRINEIYGRGITRDEFEVEYDDWDTDPNWDYEGTDSYPVVVFRGTVSITPDMYSTGDSPTGYEVESIRAFYKHDGKEIPIKTFSPKLLDYIEDQAIDQVQRG